jgi:hypothetical protein
LNFGDQSDEGVVYALEIDRTIPKFLAQSIKVIFDDRPTDLKK